MNREGARRSRAYHSFFEGYTETYNQQGKIVRVYTEDYHSLGGNPWRYKLAITGFYLIGLIAFLAGAWTDAPFNRFWLASILEGALLIVSILAGVRVAGLLMAPKRMMLRQYRSLSEKLPLYSLLMTIGEGLLLLMSIVLMIVSKEMSRVPLLLLAGTAASAAMAFTTREISYEVVDNPMKETVQGSKIF